MMEAFPANGRVAPSARHLHRGLAAALVVLALGCSTAAATPQIRTGPDNGVPRCVTPQRLMAFLKTRNPSLDSRFGNIADHYRRHGQAWRVRWDYAFFQMALETNFLTYRRGDGRWGDVNPRQNNFAGLGTTGGGVPGDSYPDVSTGVLAQIQHLVVYSGERIDQPVGARTRLKQDDILAVMQEKRGRTTFADLARRWAADRNYGRSIEWVASRYREIYCQGRKRTADPEPPPRPVKRAAADPELPRAASLGGPESGAPVRTVWSRTTAGSATPAPRPPATPDKPVVTAAVVPPLKRAPLPTRKPAVAEAAKVTPPASPVAPADPQEERLAPPPVSAPVVEAETPAEAQAFAFASGMNSALAHQPPPSSGGCRVLSASYGGNRALLVRSGTAPQLRFTVLSVLAGFEKSMLDNYLKAHAPGGTSIGEFDSRNAALAKARELCPTGEAAEAEGASAG